MRRIVPPDRLDCRSQSRAVDQYARHAMRRFGGGQSGLYAGLVGYIHPDEKTANRLCMGLALFFVEIEDRDRPASVRKPLRGCAPQTRGYARDNHKIGRDHLTTTVTNATLVSLLLHHIKN